MNPKTDIATPDQKARMRLDAERFFDLEYPKEYSRKEMTKLYARDVIRLLNELDRQNEIIQDKDSQIETLESEKITLINRANRVEEFMEIFSPPPASTPAKITLGQELWQGLAGIKNDMLKESKKGRSGAEALRHYAIRLSSLLNPELKYSAAP